MAEDKYISDLTGEQLDAAFAKMANIDQYVSQAAVSANGAQTSASAASQSAAQASDSAATAGQQATAAAGSASNAADSAEQAQASASAAAQSAQKATESAAGMSDFVQQAQASAQAAAQSASQAESSAGTAESAAQAAARSEASVSANAEKAEQAATAAAASEAAAQNSAAQAAGSASDAAASAGLIQDNLDAIQAAPGAAQAAQQAASDAQAAQTAAEDAAERAEQIADFNPSDFATAAQGSLAETAVQPDALDAYALKTEVPDTPADIGAATAAQGAKADTAVQSVNGAKPDSSGNVQLDLTTGTVRSVNGKDPDGSGNVQLSAGDVGAATAAQGALAATAVQPADLDGYAQTDDIPDELPNPQALTIRLGSGSPTTYDGSAARSVTVTPAAVGAAQEPLTGNLDDVTPAQVRASIQAGRQVSLLTDDNILSAWVDTGSNVQCLYGWDARDDYAGRSRALCINGYYGNPSSGNTWQREDLYVNVLPEVTTANNGQTVTVQNGQWQLGKASGGGVQIALLYTNPNPTSNLSGSYISVPGMSSYDLLGIVPIANTSYGLGTDCSGMQIFRNTQSTVTLSSVSYRAAGPEVQARELVLYPSSNRISVGDSSKFNYTASSEDTRVCVPYLIFGIKF